MFEEKCKTNTENVTSKVLKQVWTSKEARFIKEEKASGILSSLGVKTPLSKILFYGHVLLCFYQYKISKIVNKFLLADKYLCLKCI